MDQAENLRKIMQQKEEQAKDRRDNRSGFLNRHTNN